MSVHGYEQRIIKIYLQIEKPTLKFKQMTKNELFSITLVKTESKYLIIHHDQRYLCDVRVARTRRIDKWILHTVVEMLIPCS